MSVDGELSMGEPTPVKKQDEQSDDVELSLSESELDEVLAKREFDTAVKGFDLQAWIEGVRSARAMVRLYARPDLDEQVQALAADMFEAMNSGDKATQRKCEAKIVALKKQYFAASIDVVLEERSRDWQARKTAELKQAGVAGDRELTLALVAEQIVEPAGSFTGEDLAGLAEVIPRQINGLVEAWGKLSGVTDVKGLPTF